MVFACFLFPDSCFLELLVRPRRFELLTYSFGGCRSIQLSYGRTIGNG